MNLRRPCREIKDADDLRVSNSVVEWHGGNRFRLREYQSFVASDDRLTRLFGAHGRVAEKLEDGRLSIEFYADAECELRPGDRSTSGRASPATPPTGGDG